MIGFVDSMARCVRGAHTVHRGDMSHLTIEELDTPDEGSTPNQQLLHRQVE